MMVSSTTGERVGFCGREPSVGRLAVAAGEAAGGSVVSAMPWLDLLIALRSDQLQTDHYRRRCLEGVWVRAEAPVRGLLLRRASANVTAGGARMYGCLIRYLASTWGRPGNPAKGGT